MAKFDEIRGHTLSNLKTKNEKQKIGPRTLSKNTYLSHDESIGSESSYSDGVARATCARSRSECGGCEIGQTDDGEVQDENQPRDHDVYHDAENHANHDAKCEEEGVEDKPSSRDGGSIDNLEIPEWQQQC